jgi:quercetin dioxygenase-like cupin family protein
MEKREFFPEIITNLPEADIPLEGLLAHLLQCEDRQIIFMSFEKDTEIPEHSHEAQWGVVLDGRLDLIIDGRKVPYLKGDTYFIPKGVKHSAKIKAGYKDLTLFDQKDRYRTK